MRRSAAERREFVETRSDQMRVNMTGAERAMWEIVRPLDFVAQFPIDGCTKNGGRWSYIADFFYSGPEGRLVIEVDGSVHARTKGRDRRRGVRLAGEGIKTLRFSNNQVLRKPDEVRRQILEYLGKGEA